MTLEEFVADLRATAPRHADTDAMLAWTGEQKARAERYGLDWQDVCVLIAQQQALAVKKAVETP
jgi:hypothetical protein